MHRKSFLTEYLLDTTQLSSMEMFLGILVLAGTLFLIWKMKRK